jgi:hypothetical protein
MKRNRHTRRARQTPDSDLLVRLATGLSQSSNRIEDAWWEARLAAHIDRLLADTQRRGPDRRARPALQRRLARL